MKDCISDLLTRIRNGQKNNLFEISLFWPTPKICLQILKVLQKEGFIRGFKKTILQNKVYYVVLLKYTEFQKPIIKKIERISKPSCRLFSTSKNFWTLNNGKGCLIISTTKGLITDTEARLLNCGGEILFYIE